MGRFKLWRAAAAAFAILNVGGAGFAIASAEWMHTGVHIALGALGAIGFMTLRSRPASALAGGPPTDRLDQLQQSVDAIALEVERIGEAQRFSAQLMKERPKGQPPQGPSS